MKRIRMRLLLAAQCWMLAAPSGAHEAERTRPVETSEAVVDLGASPVVVLHEGHRIELAFVPAFGAVRASLTSDVRLAPRSIRLRVPLSNQGHLAIGFRAHGGGLISTKPLSKIPPGTILEFAERNRVHRLRLRAAR